MNIILDIVDENNRLIMRKAQPICYRVFPTNSWKEGEVFKERLRIKIPPAYFKNQCKLKIAFFDYRNGRICKINGYVDNLGRAQLLEARYR
ncbi:MAG: hypothetical protein NT066_06220 [Candidatus Omnitrophica bacterium]|nr:hypothetical protein [Candidatus Omnitrophota bacterium]